MEDNLFIVIFGTLGFICGYIISYRKYNTDRKLSLGNRNMKKLSDMEYTPMPPPPARKTKQKCTCSNCENKTIEDIVIG